MNVMQKLQILWVFPTLIYSLSAQQQACVQDAESMTDICVAYASYQNASTGNDDLYLDLSSKFHDRVGWAALGLGQEMAGALMFVMYPGRQQDEVTVSVRSTLYAHGFHPYLERDTDNGDSGHNPPQPVQKRSPGPDFEVLDPRVDTEGYHSASIICYGCKRWADTPIDLTSKAQDFIWAINSAQIGQTSNTEFSLQHHTNYGRFKANLFASRFTGQKPDMPRITSSRLSTNTGSAPSQLNFTSVRNMHRLLFIICNVSMVLAIVAIRSGHRKSYIIHVSIQVITIITAVFGFLLGVKLSLNSPANHSFMSLHQILGIILVFALPAQMILGHRHHIRYLAVASRSMVSYLHIWLGRTLVIGYSINIWLGLQLAFSDKMSFTLLYMAQIIEAIVFLTLWYVSQGHMVTPSGTGNAREEMDEEASEGDVLIAKDERDI